MRQAKRGAINFVSYFSQIYSVHGKKISKLMILLGPKAGPFMKAWRTGREGGMRKRERREGGIH